MTWKLYGVELIPEEWHVKMGDINSLWIPLGMIPVGGEMTVKQSYHIQAETGNEYQGDEMDFDIELYAEQLLGIGPGPTNNGVVLENKTGDPDWVPIIDDTWGLMIFGDSFTFEGFGLSPNTDYTLIEYPEPATWPNPIVVLDSGTSDGNGYIQLADSGPDPCLTNAKVWLVLSSDIVDGELSGWNPSDYLFESNLVTSCN